MIHPADVLLLPPERFTNAYKKKNNIDESVTKNGTYQGLNDNAKSRGYHIVKAGESPWSIAKKYGIPLAAIYGMNPNAKKMIHPGDTIKLPPGLE